jgi:hypothetical protein
VSGIAGLFGYIDFIITCIQQPAMITADEQLNWQDIHIHGVAAVICHTSVECSLG